MFYSKEILFVCFFVFTLKFYTNKVVYQIDKNLVAYCTIDFKEEVKHVK
jgi:hypothetical protein